MKNKDVLGYIKWISFCGIIVGAYLFVSALLGLEVWKVLLSFVGFFVCVHVFRRSLASEKEMFANKFENDLFEW